MSIARLRPVRAINQVGIRGRAGGAAAMAVAMALAVGCNTSPNGAAGDGGAPGGDDLRLPPSEDLHRGSADLAGAAQVAPDLAVAPFLASCTTCHGDPGRNDPAPPNDVGRHTDTAFAGVGAHQAHLRRADWHLAIACAECHVVPVKPTWDPAVPSHLNGVDDIAWGPLARSGQLDARTLRCGGSYCHGATLEADVPGVTAERAPIWTKVDGTQAACGLACHTTPPGGTHPRTNNCGGCHPKVIAAFRPGNGPGNPPSVTWVDANLHIDGKLDLDVKALNCTSCHGDAMSGRPEPPFGVNGESKTTDPAVGAHAKHLAPSTWHRSGRCEDCHAVPQSVGHASGAVDFAWGDPADARAASPRYDAQKITCGDVYCHGARLLGPAQGGRVLREPVWNKVDGTQAACGTTCHTTPPGDTHPAVATGCPLCHADVILSFTPAQNGNPATATWKNAQRHIDGVLDVKALDCTTCHGDAQSGSPAPPRGTKGELQTTDRAVGAHAQHLAQAGWHRDGQCRDCHVLPGSVTHFDGKVDFGWGAPSTADGASPAFDGARLTCAGTYCHGATLEPAAMGGVVARTPVWNQVNGTWDACGSTCHTNPPGAPHPASANCAACHGDVIAAYAAGNPPQATWVDPQRHVDGKVDVRSLTCTSCHGDPVKNTPAPPFGTRGETQTTQPAVGAHAQHLGGSTWHRAGQCVDCHAVPQSVGHTDGVIDFAWSAPADADGTSPAFDPASLRCANVYCHGASLRGPPMGGVISRAPVWNVVDGTYDSCGDTCHTTPPGGGHVQATNCEACHPAVIRSFAPGRPPTAVWNDPALHVDGKVDVAGLACTSCHGDANQNEPAPPRGTKGETQTSQPAVGAHRQHLGGSTWHRAGQCADCHAAPAFMNHFDGNIDFKFGAPANNGGAITAFDGGALTCANNYCHGATLLPAAQGGVVSRTPVWNVVDGRYDACGSTCHTNPPGGTHAASTNCAQCHARVIAAYDPNTKQATWADPALHVNGAVDVTAYHDLTNWTAPRTDPNHHGRRYFIGNQQRDEHALPCAQCHGQNLDGGTSGVSCSSAKCHASFNTCSFCHGDAGKNQVNPPLGVADEIQTNTLAVGRHVAHLTASSTHVAIPCAACHAQPQNGDLAHINQYVPSANLDSAGHHGDVTFSAPWNTMAWNVNATVGAPVTQRGTCIGSCHSNGRGGAPVTTPYWAGGAWNVGSCGTCHSATPSTGRHGDHRSQGIACAVCHPGAAVATHLNGGVDLITPVESLTMVRGGGSCGGQRVYCSGRCHGESHSACW